MYCGGKEITKQDEIELAWMFMHYGGWSDCKQTAKIENHLLDFVELAVAPEIPTEGQEFEIVGAMSQIVSKQYLDATSAGEQIKSLSPQNEAHKFGAIIPPDYAGEALHLWRLSQQPNFDETQTAQTPVSKVFPPSSTDGQYNPGKSQGPKNPTHGDRRIPSRKLLFDECLHRFQIRSIQMKPGNLTFPEGADQKIPAASDDQQPKKAVRAKQNPQTHPERIHPEDKNQSTKNQQFQISGKIPNHHFPTTTSTTTGKWSEPAA